MAKHGEGQGEHHAVGGDDLLAPFRPHRRAHRARSVEPHELAIVPNVRDAARQAARDLIEAAFDLQIPARIAVQHDLPQQIERR